MNKAEAIEKLKREEHQVPSSQEFKVSSLMPEDAWGVARIFYTIYGDRYTVDTNYIPDRLIEENGKKNILSVTARTSSGDIIGYGALYRSSAPYEGAYEIGQYMVLPHYRKTLAILRIQNHLLDTTAPAHGISVIFGEPVCHHIITQKYMLLAGFHETAIEVGLMPASVYDYKDFPGERISTLLTFKTFREKRHVIHIPGVNRDALAFVLDGMNLDRELREGNPAVPPAAETVLTHEFFESAQVARAHISSTGSGFEETVKNFEARASEKVAMVMQFCLNLGDEASGYAVKILRSRGYFLGGLLPRWFDTDGLLLQKVLHMPSMASIKLVSDRSRGMLELIRKDREENPACSETAGR
jgi:hypothetical protein